MKADAEPPLSDEEFSEALAPVLTGAPSGIIVAVSGGPDSTALMGLLAAAAGHLPPLAVASVDHGLREGSDRETTLVAERAASIGLTCHRLHWAGSKPERAILERARAARYALLIDLCHRLGASHLLTAHTLDDQAETVLFRIARGTGIAGLAAMPTIRLRDGIVHGRPLLGIAKARLIATCEARGWAYFTDPSNNDPRFARARLRRLAPTLAAAGLDADRLAGLARRAARAEAALEAMASTAERDLVPARTNHHGAVLDIRTLAGLPDEIAIRLLGRALARAGAATIRLERLERAWGILAEAFDRKSIARLSLAGTLLRLGRDGTLSILPEGPRRRGRPG